MTRNESGHHRYAVDGSEYRVVISGDVVALPDENWSGGGYGTGISEEWLFHSGNLPKGPRNRRRLWAYMIRRALADHHGYELGDRDWPFDEPPPVRR